MTLYNNYGRKLTEQFSTTDCMAKSEKIVPADTLIAQFAEKELLLRNHMFEKTESITEEQMKTMSLLLFDKTGIGFDKYNVQCISVVAAEYSET